MIVLLKLILAHFIGDFLLQPKSWVTEKERRKAKSAKLYLHVFVHGALALLILWDWHYWFLVLLLMLFHGGIDMVKLYGQKEGNKPQWFLWDQALHLISIFALWWIWSEPDFHLNMLSNNINVWAYAIGLLFITVVSRIIIQVLLSHWTKSLNDGDGESLANAGKYIGILERLFVFTFVVTGNWEAIGFLLTAKSVFRFGDLKESKDRKLTEYILIGTLLSFGIAAATGMAVLQLTTMSN